MFNLQSISEYANSRVHKHRDKICGKFHQCLLYITTGLAFTL
jgi:hypothetical protein